MDDFIKQLLDDIDHCVNQIKLDIHGIIGYCNGLSAVEQKERGNGN